MNIPEVGQHLPLAFHHGIQQMIYVLCALMDSCSLEFLLDQLNITFPDGVVINNVYAKVPLVILETMWSQIQHGKQFFCMPVDINSYLQQAYLSQSQRIEKCTMTLCNTLLQCDNLWWIAVSTLMILNSTMGFLLGHSWLTPVSMQVVASCKTYFLYQQRYPSGSTIFCASVYCWMRLPLTHTLPRSRKISQTNFITPNVFGLQCNLMRFVPRTHSCSCYQCKDC